MCNGYNQVLKTLIGTLVIHFWEKTKMIRNCQLFLLLSMFAGMIGCGEQGGPVATEDEIKAHVEEHGDLGLDPAASTDIID